MNKEFFESYLHEQASHYFADKNPLNEAILYSLLAPGKRIRPLLCLGFAQGLRGKRDVALASGMAVEMIHAYSLIHDDLPAMDNDDFRRGLPTNHKVFGEARAILAGDSLLDFAPLFLLEKLTSLQVDPALSLELTTLLLHSSGHTGMVKGQMLDMENESQDHSAVDRAALDQTLRKIHLLKTGAIITWSCVAGLYSTLETSTIKQHRPLVENIGQKIGLLFQVIDDILDVTSSLDELGKTPGKDDSAGKLTYTQLHGLPGAVSIARELINGIRAELKNLESVQGDWSLVQKIITSLEEKLP